MEWLQNTTKHLFSFGHNLTFLRSFCFLQNLIMQDINCHTRDPSWIVPLNANWGFFKDSILCGQWIPRSQGMEWLQNKNWTSLLFFGSFRQDIKCCGSDHGYRDCSHNHLHLQRDGSCWRGWRRLSRWGSGRWAPPGLPPGSASGSSSTNQTLPAEEIRFSLTTLAWKHLTWFVFSKEIMDWASPWLYGL